MTVGEIACYSLKDRAEFAHDFAHAASRTALEAPLMARTIEITFPESSGLHRVRNFAEELSLTLGELGDLPMDQADAATTKIVVSKIGKRDVGRCTQLVERLLKKHLMEFEATINSK